MVEIIKNSLIFIYSLYPLIILKVVNLNKGRMKVINKIEKGIKPSWNTADVNLSFVGSKRNIFIHCRGGFGRSGVIAARLLVEFGYPAIEAIRKVRDVRPGSLETIEQENNVIAFSKGI